MTIRVVVFTPEPLLQLAVAATLEKLTTPSSPIALCGNLGTIPELLTAAKEHQPHVALLAIAAGLECGVLKTFHEMSPETKLVLWGDEVPPGLAAELMERGLRGILRRQASPNLLVKCIEKVYAGELWFEKSMTDSLLNGRKVKLSKREYELVRLLTQGLKNKEIAWTLKISEGTVKVYLSKLFTKTGVKDRLELALFGLTQMQFGSTLGESSSDNPRSVFLGTKSAAQAAGRAKGRSPKAS